MNGGLVDLIRCFPAEHAAGSAIEPALDESELGPADQGQIGALGQRADIDKQCC